MHSGTVISQQVMATSALSQVWYDLHWKRIWLH